MTGGVESIKAQGESHQHESRPTPVFNVQTGLGLRWIKLGHITFKFKY